MRITSGHSKQWASQVTTHEILYNTLVYPERHQTMRGMHTVIDKAYYKCNKPHQCTRTEADHTLTWQTYHKCNTPQCITTHRGTLNKRQWPHVNVATTGLLLLLLRNCWSITAAIAMMTMTMIKIFGSSEEPVETSLLDVAVRSGQLYWEQQLLRKNSQPFSRKYKSLLNFRANIKVSQVWLSTLIKPRGI